MNRSQFFPRSSGPHRIACIALYRALLFQCSRLELPTEHFRGPINPIKHQIRKQFRRNKNETSVRLVVAALNVGYETEELLRSAGDGDVIAFSKVISLLIDIQSEGDADRIRVALNPVAPKPRHRRPEPYPNALPLLESRPRPLSELSGRRHVPVLVAANLVPFLRVKKPQSSFLSRVIRDKIKQRVKWQEQLNSINILIDWAADEDEWDDLLAKEVVAEDHVSWEREMRGVSKDLGHKLHNATQKNLELSRRMLEIVDEEKRLFEEERVQRKRETSRRRREMKLNNGSSSSMDLT